MKIELGAITEARLHKLKSEQPGCYKLIKGSRGQICCE